MAAGRPEESGPLGINEMPDRWGFVISVDTLRLRKLGARLEALGAVYGDAYDAEMDEETQQTVLNVQKVWPVDTGRSRGTGAWRGYGWNSVRRGKFRYSIVNPQPYVVFVLEKGSKRPKNYSAANPDLQINRIVKPMVLALRKQLLLTGRGLVARLVRNRSPGGGGGAAPRELPSVPGSPQRGRGPGVAMVERARREAETRAARENARAAYYRGRRERQAETAIQQGRFIFF